MLNFLLFFVKKFSFLINLVDLCGFCGFFLEILRHFAQTFWSHCPQFEPDPQFLSPARPDPQEFTASPTRPDPHFCQPDPTRHPTRKKASPRHHYWAPATAPLFRVARSSARKKARATAKFKKSKKKKKSPTP